MIQVIIPEVSIFRKSIWNNCLYQKQNANQLTDMKNNKSLTETVKELQSIVLRENHCLLQTTRVFVNQKSEKQRKSRELLATGISLFVFKKVKNDVPVVHSFLIASKNILFYR